MNRCTHTIDGWPCPLPARLNGFCLAHQPAHAARRHTSGPTTQERVEQRIRELGDLHPRKTPIAITAQAWREIAHETAPAATGGGPA